MGDGGAANSTKNRSASIEGAGLRKIRCVATDGQFNKTPPRLTKLASRGHGIDLPNWRLPLPNHRDPRAAAKLAKLSFRFQCPFNLFSISRCVFAFSAFLALRAPKSAHARFRFNSLSLSCQVPVCLCVFGGPKTCARPDRVLADRIGSDRDPHQCPPQKKNTT